MWMGSRDIAESGYGAVGSLIGILATGHWISRGIDFETPHFLRKKLLRLSHGLAFDLAEVDLAQAFVDSELESGRTRGRGSCFARTSQRRGPDCGQSGLGSPSGDALILRISTRVQRHIGNAGIAVLRVPNRRPVTNEKEVYHRALW